MPTILPSQSKPVDARKVRSGADRRREPDEWDKTIVAISPYQLKDLVLPEGPDTRGLGGETEQQVFKIRLAHSNERVNSASMLSMCNCPPLPCCGAQSLPDSVTFRPRELSPAANPA